MTRKWLGSALFVCSMLLTYKASAFDAKVVGIKDGDTIVVFDGTSSTTIRLAAIDAPEKSQAFGEAAKKAMSSICFGKMATVNPINTDRYSRTVADVFCAGKNAGEWMVYNGFAWVYDRYVSGHIQYYGAQKIAREQRKGLWQDNNPIAPWDFRVK
ncbi:thermonuclease family protein [Hydromonas duriensis]|uniref:Endonuclease YncB(Thermonuclease family) n=1 Tax=Hydromonas duriensis TaxID=1527608 RepID=A0A4R6Y447_9BURK|nr:thermonuclease family protein [Hydromonas duriensis]TDR27775.1 endonuclease YncB(thermonuclease family) [Hydromonas duriensis]